MSNMQLDPHAIAGMIDHTLLKPEATRVQIEQLCDQALRYQFAAVCVNPVYVPLCAQRLAGNPVQVCTVIGFPLGATLTAVKVYEAQQTLAAGAREVDMVINIGALKSQDESIVAQDIAAVVQAAHTDGARVKVIIETCLLTDAEKIKACELSSAAGADFVKTSTGFGSGGATAADVALMRRIVGPALGVKASGGIRTWADMQTMIAAGANRVGASASVAIMQEAGAV